MITNENIMFKLFVKRLAYILSPVLLMLLCYEILYRNIPNSYQYKDYFLQNRDSVKDLKVLILGSSNAYLGINPVFFRERGFNAGNVSQSLRYDYFILNKYIESLPSLEYVILPISYVSLFSELENGDEDWRVKKYQLYMNSDIHSNLIPKYNLECAKKLDGVIIEHYLLGQNFKQCTSLGWGTMYREHRADLDFEHSGEERGQAHTYFPEKYDNDIYLKNVDFVNKIALLCQKKNIKLCLLTPPAYSSYYNHLNKVQLDMMYRVISDIVMWYPQGVVYVDLLRDKRFFKSDFHDSDHLCEKGAEKLSKIIDGFLFEKWNSFVLN